MLGLGFEALGFKGLRVLGFEGWRVWVFFSGLRTSFGVPLGAPLAFRLLWLSVFFGRVSLFVSFGITVL